MEVPTYHKLHIKCVIWLVLKYVYNHETINTAKIANASITRDVLPAPLQNVSPKGPEAQQALKLTVPPANLLVEMNSPSSSSDDH